MKASLTPCYRKHARNEGKRKDPPNRGSPTCHGIISSFTLKDHEHYWRK
jgi:hypothetical protein